MVRGDRECTRMHPEHPWIDKTCSCGRHATHVCAQDDIEFAVACEWHAFAWVRQAAA